MIRIFKDNDIKVVTQGVYDNLYKPLGYKPVIEEKPIKAVVKETVEPKTVSTNIPKESSKISKKK